MVLRSNAFMSNVLAAAEPVAHEGRLYAPAGEARIAMIDPRDVGAAAAAVLSTPGHDGQTYVLTGPEAITYAQVAAELSAATGRQVEFIDVPDEGAKQGLIEAGLPDFVAEQVVEVFAMLRLGAASRSRRRSSRSPDVLRATSPPSPTTTRALFSPVAVGAGR